MGFGPTLDDIKASLKKIKPPPPPPYFTPTNPLEPNGAAQGIAADCVKKIAEYKTENENIRQQIERLNKDITDLQTREQKRKDDWQHDKDNRYSRQLREKYRLPEPTYTPVHTNEIESKQLNLRRLQDRLKYNLDQIAFCEWRNNFWRSR